MRKGRLKKSSMELPITRVISGTPSRALLAKILGRSESLFAEDLEVCRPALCEAITGRRFLVAGAAGSIGAAFVEQILPYAPAALHLIDPNENALVEVVRDVRSSPVGAPAEFRTFSIGIGTAEFDAFLAAGQRYDSFVNFAAMKHVRSERDPFSLLRMIDINVRALADALDRLSSCGANRVFSVSSDKAVRPASAMGATKALMEQVIAAAPRGTATTARFANVAFSAGSLLDGFLRRLAKGQPLAGPSDVRRYFISHEEAGQLCLLAACAADHRHILFPKLQENRDLRTFAEIAVDLLAEQGFEPILCSSEEHALSTPPTQRGWPCYFAPARTTGEKPYEEFCLPDEDVRLDAYRSIGVACGRISDPLRIRSFLDACDRLRAQPTWSRQEALELISRFVPDMARPELEADLDQGM